MPINHHTGEMLLIETVQNLPLVVKNCVDAGDLPKALSAIVRTVEEALEMMTEVRVFKLDRSDLKQRMRADSTIHAAYETLRFKDGFFMLN